MTFEERFQAARAALLRRYPWSAPTLLALRPVERDKGTLSVDPWSRLYFNRTYADALTDAAFVGAIWHETNHLLRRHADRFDGMADTRPAHKLANIAADAEINADLRGKVTLPDNVVFPETFGDVAGKIAEDYYGRLTDDAEQKAEDAKRKRDEERDAEDDTDDDDANASEDGDDDSDGEETEDGEDSDDDGQADDEASKDDSVPDDGADDDRDEQDADDGADGDASGGDDPEETPDDPGNDGSDGNDDDGDDVSDSDDGSPSDADDESDEELDDDEDEGCGSGSGGNGDDELPEPDEDEQAEAEARAREQAEATLDAVNSSPPGRGPGQSVIDAARALLGHSTFDWRATFAKVVRAAFEQATDEAEEYSFRRPSRRASAVEPGIIPGSYRPTPLLSVLVDGSGSMDADKVTAALTEVAGVLERIAIPSFMGHVWSDGSAAMSGEANTDEDGCDGHRTIRTPDDAARLLDAYTAGGTAMLPGVIHALKDANGMPEVVVVLTDAEDSSWTVDNPCPAVPVIVGGINATDAYVAQLPSWVVYVDVMPELDADGNVVRKARRF